jgi:hypothetical protein
MKKIGWAEPEYVVSQPRIQKVDGFHYFYLEKKGVSEMGVGEHILPMIAEASKNIAESNAKVGEVTPLLVMFIDVPGKLRYYDMQVGFSVAPDVKPVGEAMVRYVKPALSSSALAWGEINMVPKTYGLTIDFAKEKGFEGAGEWREWYLYWEKDVSRNNVTLVQWILKEE